MVSEISRHYDKKGDLTLNDVQNLVEEHHPGIDIKVTGTKSHDNLLGGFVEKYGNNLTFEKLALMLPTKKTTKGKEIIEQENLSAVAHELRHMNDTIYNPSYAAKKNMYHHLEIPTEEWETRSNEFKQIFNLFLYSKEIKEEKLPTNKRLKKLKTNINAYFNKVGFSPEERIVILQNWRKRLQTEENAHRTHLKMNFAPWMFLLDSKIPKLRKKGKVEQAEKRVAKEASKMTEKHLSEELFYPQASKKYGSTRNR